MLHKQCENLKTKNRIIKYVKAKIYIEKNN